MSSIEGAHRRTTAVSCAPETTKPLLPSGTEVAPPANAGTPLKADTSAAATPPGQSESAPTAKPAYPPPAEMPTQQGPKGLRFDFNCGCRVLLPEREHLWKVCLRDLDTGNILLETELKSGRINSSKHYFVRFRVQAMQQDEILLSHDYDASGHEVLIQFPGGTLGDTIGWLPYAVKFKELHRCKLTCGIGEKLIPLFRDAYPDITFVTHEQIKPEQYYATYSVGLFFDDKECVHQPCDFRHVGLHRTAGYILGVDPTEGPPRIKLTDNSRPIPESYVCIGVQSTTQAKYWNNPMGWHEIVRFLREAGYRVICIDQKPVHGTGLIWNHIPNGAEDQTGDRPLTERARWLKHAEFFVGLSSGLSWLAWAMRTPVVMISGFTHPINEFATPYRVINYHTCNGCWNDPHLRFEHKDFLWCPRHKDTPRQFECTRLITVEHVKATIQRLPGFGSLKKSRKAKESRKDGQGKANKERSRGQPHKKKQARDAPSTKQRQRREDEVLLASRRAGRIEGQKTPINRARGRMSGGPRSQAADAPSKKVLALCRMKRRDGAGLPFAFVKCNPQRNEQPGGEHNLGG